MATGNFFNDLANEIKNKKESDILALAARSMQEFISASQMTNPKRILQALLLAATIGVEGKKQLNEKEKSLIDNFFGDLCTDMSVVYDFITQPITDKEWGILEMFPNEGGAVVGMPLLKLILCFAYVDGMLSDNIAKKIENIFGLALLLDSFTREPLFQPCEIKEEVREAEAEVRKAEEETRKAEEKARKAAEKKEREARFKSCKAECDQRVEQLKKDLDKEVKQREKQLNEQCDNEIRSAEKALVQWRQSLASCGFFAFSQKSEAKKNIRLLNEKLTRLHSHSDIREKKAWYEQVAENAVTSYRKMLDAYLDLRFPSVIESENESENESDRANAYLEEQIVHVLRDGKKCTVSALITAINPGFMGVFPTIFLSSSRVTGIVQKMTSDGVLVRSTENSKAYFSLGHGCHCKKEKVNKRRTEDPAHSSDPIPEAPNVKKILGD